MNGDDDDDDDEDGANDDKGDGDYKESERNISQHEKDVTPTRKLRRDRRKRLFAEILQTSCTIVL